MAFRIAPLALGAMLLSAECRADWKFKPALDLRETYSDNVWLQTDDLAQHEFISEAAPSLTLTNNGRRLKLTANAEWRVFGYGQRGLVNDTLPPGANPALLDRRQPNSSREYRALATAMLAEDLLYVDALADRRRQPITAFGPVTTETYSNVNRSEISSWSISPYLQHRFGHVAALTARVSRDAVKGGSSFGFGNSTATTRMVQLTSAQTGAAGTAAGMGAGGNALLGGAGAGGTVAGTAAAVSAARGSPFGWTLSYMHQDLVSQIPQAGVQAGRTSFENAIASLRWRVARTVNLTAETGYDSYTYESLAGAGTSGKRWSAGFIWTPSARTSLQASVGHRYFGKTGMLAFSERTRNAVWTLDYMDEVTTTRSQFLLPASIDTAAMLDRMFTAQFPDPVLRQQAVQAYMASTGLPASMTESINFLSNRYLRDKRLQGAVVWRMARSNLALSIYRDERRALSVQQSDSVLLGSALSSLNENIRQHGATLSFNYNLSPRTSLSAALDANASQSLSSGIDNHRRTARLGMSRRVGRRANASLELRRAQGGLAQGSSLALGRAGGYHENAVVANLSVQY